MPIAYTAGAYPTFAEGECPEGRGEAPADMHLLYAPSVSEDEGATATKES